MYRQLSLDHWDTEGDLKKQDCNGGSAAACSWFLSGFLDFLFWRDILGKWRWHWIMSIRFMSVTASGNATRSLTHHVRDPAPLQVDVQFGFCSDFLTLLLHEKNSSFIKTQHVFLDLWSNVDPDPSRPRTGSVFNVESVSHLQPVLQLLQLSLHFLQGNKEYFWKWLWSINICWSD